MPGARCTRSLVCEIGSAHERSHHRFTGATRHSLRNGFTAYSVLSPVTGLSCHRRCADNPAKLDASVGASGPHGFAVRVSTIRQARCPRPPHPAPNVRDDRDTPLFRDGMAGHVHLIWVRRERKYFCKWGWTPKSLICPPPGKSVRRVVPVLCHTPPPGLAFGEPDDSSSGVSSLRPHPEERALARVSKDGRESMRCAHPSRRLLRKLLRMRTVFFMGSFAGDDGCDQSPLGGASGCTISQLAACADRAG